MCSFASHVLMEVIGTQAEGQKTQAELANTRSKADNLRNSLLTTQRSLTASQDATQELKGKASNLEKQLAAEVRLLARDCLNLPDGGPEPDATSQATLSGGISAWWHICMLVRLL